MHIDYFEDEKNKGVHQFNDVMLVQLLCFVLKPEVSSPVSC